MQRRFAVIVIVAVAVAGAAAPDPARAESAASIQERLPDLFHPETGYRVGRQRVPVPDDVPPPVERIDTSRAVALHKAGAVFLDVFGALRSRYDELDGTWLVGEDRLSIPGALWLPEVGRGTLGDDLERYLATHVERLSEGARDRPIVVFCVSDCWMSWNASQRIAAMGYTDVSWFPLGTDGWLEAGQPLAKVVPVPVDVD